MLKVQILYKSFHHSLGGQEQKPQNQETHAQEEKPHKQETHLLAFCYITHSAQPLISPSKYKNQLKRLTQNAKTTQKTTYCDIGPSMW